MNIAIAEILRKANEESNMILKNTSEQSIKRKQQLETYKQDKKYKDEGYISNLILRLKTYWYC
jgi:hypothetical protein